MSRKYLQAAKGSLVLSTMHLSRNHDDRTRNALDHAASSLIKGGKPKLAEKIRNAILLMNHDPENAIKEIQDTVFRLEEAMKQGVSIAGIGIKRQDAREIKDVSCHSCSGMTPKHSQFCCQCGTKLAKPVCDSCNILLDLGSNFCNQCGKEMTKIQESLPASGLTPR